MIMRMRDEDSHEAGLRAGKAWERIKSGSRRTWLDWTTEIGPWLVKARGEAMAMGQTNRPVGRRYTVKMSELLKSYGLDDLKESARADLLKIMAALPEVEAWRERQDHPEYQNNPSGVWRKFRLFIRLQDKREGESKPATALLGARLNRHFNHAWTLMQTADNWPALSKTEQRHRERLMRDFMTACDGLRALAQQCHREPVRQAQNAGAPPLQ